MTILVSLVFFVVVTTGVVAVPHMAPAAVMVVAVPATWWWLQRRRRRGSTRDADDAATPPDENSTVQPSEAGTPEALTTTELCRAWQRSHFALLDLPAGPALCEVARIRESLLDEFERRDHDMFAHWLHSDAPPGSDPERYLATVRPVREPPAMK